MPGRLGNFRRNFRRPARDRPKKTSRHNATSVIPAMRDRFHSRKAFARAHESPFARIAQAKFFDASFPRVRQTNAKLRVRNATLECRARAPLVVSGQMRSARLEAFARGRAGLRIRQDRRCRRNASRVVARIRRAAAPCRAAPCRARPPCNVARRKTASRADAPGVPCPAAVPGRSLHAGFPMVPGLRRERGQGR